MLETGGEYDMASHKRVIMDWTHQLRNKLEVWNRGGIGSLRQEVGGTLVGKNGLVVMTGAASEEWYHIHHTHFQVFDAIPFGPFRPLL